MQARPATIDDLPAIEHLWQEHMVILSESDSRFRPYLDQRETWKSNLIDRLDGVFVVEKDDMIIGYIAGEHRDGYGLIQEIALDAHTYHAGLGRLLYQTIRDWFGDVKNILVYAPRYHAVEQAFWLSLGAKKWTIWQTPPERVWMIL